METFQENPFSHLLSDCISCDRNPQALSTPCLFKMIEVAHEKIASMNDFVTLDENMN